MEYRLLGPLEVRSSGRRIDLAGPKQRLVLAHLLLNANRALSADRLIDRVWGDDPPRTARSSLKTYVARLRRAIGHDAIESHPGGYLLRADDEAIDAAAFERLVTDARRAAEQDPSAAIQLVERALALWRGPVLDDLADEASLQPAIQQLNELRLEAVELRADSLLAIGRVGEAIVALDGAVAANPLREPLWQALMLALYRDGRQADALAAYHRARKILVDELGLDPGPELQRLQERILRQDPTLQLGGVPLRGYQVLEPIGSGSVGVVHRAIQRELGREVALKLIRAELADDPGFIRRFEREAQRVSQFEHPHVVPLYDYWREPGAAYLVMPLLRGGSLEHRLADKAPLSPDEVIGVIDRIAAALDAAHRQGIAHGRVGARNILFNETGEAYLADFATGTEPDAGRRSAARDVGDLARLGRALASRVAPVDVVGRIPEETGPTASATELAAVLRHALGGLGALGAPSSSGAAVRNPFKGLRSFSEADADDFRGREALTAELVERMAERSGTGRFLAVVGPSGSGKSSVVRAGLLPRIRNGALLGSESWYMVEMRPTGQPFEELARSLRRVSADPAPDLGARLERDDAELVRAADALLPAGDAELVLVVDQFEELFHAASPETRRRFMASLHRAVAEGGSRVRVIVTLRADYFDRPLQEGAFGRLLAARSHVVPPLSPAEVESAIVGPAASVGVSVEPGALRALVADVVNQPGALPLLQYALTELFERRDGATMTEDAYRAIGGLAGVLGRRADRIYRRLEPEARAAARQLFLRLVTVAEERVHARRRTLQAEIASLELDRSVVDRVVESFGAHRLLSFDRDPETRQATVELAHEALIERWPRLRTWIDTARDDIAMHRRLLAAAEEWVGSDRDASYLLRAGRLELFQSWAADTDIALGAHERELLAASGTSADAERIAAEAQRAREARLERRSLVRLRALLAVVLVGAVVAGGLAVVARLQATLAGGRELAASALGVLDEDPELSILLALRAAEVADPPVEAVRALHQAVQASRTVCTARLDGGEPIGASVGADLSADGDLLVVTGDGRFVDVWDVTRCERTTRLGEAVEGGNFGGLALVALSPDGRRVMTVDPEAVAHVWELGTGRERRFQVPGSGPGLVAISPDGSRAATVTSDAGQSLVVLWDLSTATELARWSVAFTTEIRFHPDGRRLIVSDYARWEVRLLDARDGSSRLVTTGDGPMQGASVHPDGSLVATGGVGRAHLWEAATGRTVRTFSHPGEVRLAVFGPRGERLLTTNDSGTARVWDVQSGDLLMTLAGHEGNALSLAVSADGTRVATASSDRSARVWDTSAARPGEVGGYDVGGPAAAFDRIGSVTAVLTRGLRPLDPGPLVILDTATGRRLELPQRSSPSGSIRGTAVALLPDASGVVSQVAVLDDGGRWAGGGAIEVRELWSGDRVGFLREICADGPQTDGCAEPPATPFAEAATDLALSEDGRWLAVGGYSRAVSLWDATSGELVDVASDLSPDAIGGLAFSPDGTLLVATGGRGGPTSVLAVPSLEVVAELPTTNPVGAMFSPDGTRLAVVSATDRPAVFLVDGWTLERRLDAVGATWSLDFSDDGTLLATGHSDGVVRVWDVRSDELLHLIPLAAANVTGVSFLSDARHILVGTDARALWVVTTDVDELIRIARDRVTRDLTDAECVTYLHAPCP